jgi:dihydrodipicolinate synthase/N-acetylneuraminate lyase
MSSTTHRLFFDAHVIPAHPLALTAERKLDEDRQCRLTRYYLESGAGGIAVGVHTTQFAIHRPESGLYRPVLELCAGAIREHEENTGRRIARIAGIVGDTAQAVRETELARDFGYDAGLVSPAAFRDSPESELLDYCCILSKSLPVVGFYLQPSVGGRRLSYDFWRRFCEIPDVVAIKVAPFDRYATLDVVRAVADSGRADEIALLTGNDDNFLIDLLTPFRSGNNVMHFAGGLLGHWAFQTRLAMKHFELALRIRRGEIPLTGDILALAARITDFNGAIFDAANRFAGCIPGIHEMLRRQGLLAGNWCFDPHETLSSGQIREIDRVCQTHPDLWDVSG